MSRLPQPIRYSCSMPTRAPCTICSRRPGRRVECKTCGALVGPVCCWDLAKEKCVRCAGCAPVRRCQECDYRSVDHILDYPFHWSKYKSVEQIHVAEDQEGNKISRVRNVYFCVECWSEMFNENSGGKAQGESSASSSSAPPAKQPRT